MTFLTMEIEFVRQNTLNIIFYKYILISLEFTLMEIFELLKLRNNLKIANCTFGCDSFLM